MPGTQLRAAPVLQPGPQRRVRQAPPQPAQRVPVADREDAADDQVAVGGPGQAAEVVVPEEGTEGSREHRDATWSRFFHSCFSMLSVGGMASSSGAAYVLASPGCNVSRSFLIDF